MEKVCLRDELVPHCDVMTCGPLEPGSVPSVLDLPVARRHQEAADHGPTTGAGDGFAGFGHGTESDHPVGMQASTGKRPSSVDPPSAGHTFRRADRLNGTREDHIGSVTVNSVVGLTRQQGWEKSADASRCEHAKHTDGSKRRDQMGRDASLGLDLGCVSGNSRCELGDVGKNTLSWIECLCGRCKNRVVSDFVEIIVLL